MNNTCAAEGCFSIDTTPIEISGYLIDGVKDLTLNVCDWHRTALFSDFMKLNVSLTFGPPAVNVMKAVDDDS